MNVVKTDFCVTDNVKILLPKYAVNASALLYILHFGKTIPNLWYARHWSVAKNSLISLCVKAWQVCMRNTNPISKLTQHKGCFAGAQNGKVGYTIALDFMESYIKAIQKAYINHCVLPRG